MSTEDIPEPDRVEGAPHPRRTAALFGQPAAEEAFLTARDAGRLHHAWLIAGPRGVGKATLAWRIARNLLAGAGGPLDMAPDQPVFRRCAALSEPRLFLLRRAWDAKAARLRQIIDVEETRRLKTFLQLSSADGGWRAVIVDAAEEMNTSAANALLKVLEEPPERTAFLLVCHAPARLLPTIRSRCRELRCGPLDAASLAAALDAAGLQTDDATALAELSGGSAGEAMRLAAHGGQPAYEELLALLATLPRLDRPRMIALADSCAGRDAAERYDMMMRLVPLALSRFARAGALGALPVEAARGEGDLIRRLSPGPGPARAWAEAVQRLGERMARARSVNLDPGQVMLDTFLDIETTAQRLASAA
ncbi:DNA polymerase III subunit delta' [Paroceanicella profunda]|uniref:DNA polymerase III subunit delta n=1 Tax=Paroceanicella profunda TaxID=2579971 RepID=A0A5B8FU20_9RHOB|nr:DNA polymerase III subunit delta' [Paroceanicella profunda]QDL90754.1 DNA polymerase III subunit delta' [Paroceanicella profunda]